MLSGMDRYTKVEKGQSHGEGAYGVVYKGKDRVTGNFVAMKVRRRRAVVSGRWSVWLTSRPPRPAPPRTHGTGLTMARRKSVWSSRTRACRAPRFAKSRS